MPLGPSRSAGNLKEKISLLCDVPISGVISAIDAPSIYKIPLVLHQEGLDAELARHLRIDAEPDLTEWETLVERIDRATEPVDDRGRREVREHARRLPVA